MEIDIYSIKKLDSKGFYKLDEGYLLSYSHKDGWNDRGLNIDFFIDIYFECLIRLSFLDKSFKRIDLQFKIELPMKIRDLISNMMNLDELKLKFIYADTFMEDSGEENFVINHKNISHNVCIGILNNKIVPSNISEQIFFNLHKEFEMLKKEVYINNKNLTLNNK